jgi:hypothetical protein
MPAYLNPASGWIRCHGASPVNEPKTRSRVRRLILLSVAAGAIAGVGMCGYRIYQDANRAAAESAHRALLSEVHAQLELYRSDHGAYPRNLSELQIADYQDGASPAMLRQLHYDSAGTTYTLRYFGRRSAAGAGSTP